jgi:diguanylate cyclase (GGDEF)-like protein
MYLPEGWLSAVFNAEGQFVARSHDASVWLGKSGPQNVFARAAEVPEGWIETRTVSGVDAIGTYIRSDYSGWITAIAIPEEVLTAEVKGALSLLIGFTLLFLMISLYLAWTLSDCMVASIHALVRPAKALGHNQEVRIPPLYLKELEEVGQALREASEVLRQTTHEANHDSLTGPANRSLFLHLTKQNIASCERNGRGLAVLFIDLDGFKHINDTYGHATGDALLRASAARIQITLRQTDVAARVGGDEFAAVLADVDAQGAAIVGGKLVKALGTPFPMGKATIDISASIGIAMHTRADVTAEQLITKADEAMYEAKVAGKRRYVVASPS